MILNAQAQKQIKVAHRFYFNAGYLFSTNSNNSKESKPLFASNGIITSVAYGLELHKQFGIMTHVDYNFGALNKKGITNFMNSLPSPIPLTYSTTKTNWSQVNAMMGVLVKPILKVPFFIELTAGIGINPNPNTIVIQQNDNGSIGNTLYSAKEKSTIPVWNKPVAKQQHSSFINLS